MIVLRSTTTRKEKKKKESHINPMLHGQDNIEMDTTRGYVTNSLKYTWHVCLTRFGYDMAP